MAQGDTGKTIAVRVMGIPGCKNAEKARDLVRKEARSLDLAVEIVRVEIENHEQAVKERMSGSPTVLINGLDIDPARRESDKFGIT